MDRIFGYPEVYILILICLIIHCFHPHSFPPHLHHQYHPLISHVFHFRRIIIVDIYDHLHLHSQLSLLAIEVLALLLLFFSIVNVNYDLRYYERIHSNIEGRCDSGVIQVVKIRFIMGFFIE